MSGERALRRAPDRRLDRRLAGPGRRLPRRRRRLLRAGEGRRTPASRGPGATRRAAGDRRAVHALGARRRRLPAGVSRETLARALATPEARERFAERYGIDDAELAQGDPRRPRPRAIDDAEEAGALSPLIAVPLREHGPQRPARPGDRTPKAPVASNRRRVLHRPRSAPRRIRFLGALLGPARAASRELLPCAGGQLAAV